LALIISIAIIASLLTGLIITVMRPNKRLTGAQPVGVLTFAAILFTSGLDVGLIMFPLTEFPVYAAEDVYNFSNPLAVTFGAWGFLVWGLYFLTTFYFCAIEPHIKLFEIPIIKAVYNLVVIATCAFTGFLFFKYLPDYIQGISPFARYGLVAAVILLAVLSSTRLTFIKWLSLSSSWLFYGLILFMLIASGIGFSGLWGNLALMADYVPNMHKFVTPISDYHQFYLYWWMAWSIMIGQFVARFVGGIKIWQLLAVLLTIPSITIALWFAVLYGYYTNAIEISAPLKLAMVGVGILFVLNSLDSLTRLYTDNLNMGIKRLGFGRYTALNWGLLFGLILLYQHTELKIEWVGLITIGLYITIAMMMNFDYVIVGAGSAGCILANRLSENPKHSVALIEAGGSDQSIFVRMPSALAIPMNTKRFNWGFESVAEPHLNGRVIPCYRGKGLGGTSSINGMVFVRGNPNDIDEWESCGAAGWTYKKCLPYYKKLEHWQGGESAFRGGSGPIGVSTGNNMRLSPLYQAFIDAGVEAGYPRCDDYNGESQEGFSAMQMNVDGGVRASTARAYLKPASRRPNLTIFKKALTQRVCFDGTKATGIDVVIKGKSQRINAKREVILSAGAIGSPQLLQSSGVGPESVLKAAGVTPLHGKAGVGENLTDHLEVFFQYECTQPITLNGKLDPFSKALIGLRWLLFRNGLGATNHFESCGFIRSSETKAWPDIQYHFLPGAISYDGNTAFKGHGYQVHVGPNKPASRGHVHIKSPNINDHPAIQFNYLKDEADKQDWRNTIRITRNVLQQAALAPYRGKEIQPGGDITSDAAIDAWVQDNVESAYHPTSTCRMGAEDDPMAVINAKCQVIGLQNLRVVDSSIFPTIPNGNLNAPTMMVAERAADIIKGDHKD